MNIKACIYNLDGVVTDTTKFHYESWKWVSNELGYNLTSKQNLKLRNGSKREALERILKWSLNRISESEKQELLNTKNKMYMDAIAALVPANINEGFTEFNSAIRALGLKAAISSSSKNAIRIIDKLDLVLDFDAIVDGGMLEDPHWESIERFELAAQKMGLENNECILFQNSIGPIDEAVKAGFNCIIVGESVLNPNVKNIQRLQDIDTNAIQDIFNTSYSS